MLDPRSSERLLSTSIYDIYLLLISHFSFLISNSPPFCSHNPNTIEHDLLVVTGTVAPPAGVAPVFTGAPVAPVYAPADAGVAPVFTGAPVAPVYAPATDNTYPAVPAYTEPLAADPAGALAPPAYPATASLRRN